MKNKKLLGVLGVAALLLAGNFAWQKGEEVNAAATTRTVFLNPGPWNTAGAWFDAWVWGEGNSGEWMTFSDSDGDGIFSASLPAGVDDMHLLRKNPSSNNHNWDYWNRIDNLKLPTGEQNCYYVYDDWKTGAWGKYSLSINGTFIDNWKTPIPLSDLDNDGIFTATQDLNPGSYEFKIKDSSEKWRGGSKITDTTKDNAFKTSGGNTTFTASGGQYTFEYNATVGKLTVTHKTYSDLVKKLFTTYYNEGSYTKVSDIFVNEEVEQDVAQYFHTGNIAELHRTTVYSDGRLLMTTEKDTNGVGYKTVGEDMVRFHVVDGQDVNDYTVKGTSVEAYYVTLADFLLSSSTSHYGTLDMLSGWTYANGIYSNSSEDVLDAFRLFTAPMWVGKTAETENYIIFSKATVEVVDGKLVMKLWATGEESKLTSTDGLFSQAVISLD